MISFWIFVLSGLSIITITLAKRFELKQKRSNIVLRFVSRSDEHIRKYYHEALHFYSEGKHRFLFVVRKQLPLKVKSYLNKGVDYVREKGEERFGNIRGSKQIKRPENISEFFKSISEVERGKGEIVERISVVSEEEEIITEPVVEAPSELVSEPEPQTEAKPEPKPKTRKPRTQKRKASEDGVVVEAKPTIPELPEVEVVRTNPQNFKPRSHKRKVKVVELGE